jgi:hypothetical protein
MPFDGNAERSAPVCFPDAPQNEPPIEARIIDEALKILGPHGERWIQRQLYDRSGGHCMIGAILCACDQLGIKAAQTVELVVEAFSTSEFIPENAGDIPEQISELIQNFNDEPGRPFGHIDQVLRKARELAVSRC